ncbi:AraC family transcriptional regulator [Fulvivirga sediminis]|uniref:AraC family transcriptional regulator n=1 Tax=Fulvivirga sediminis TaxID=2803949 RepID=A0A937K2J7_9BACT|nr:helix-turn-helix domain-containing protein [Fulvivirga sediminis]MBL3658450.1 AraC family transcriptional regulator [Fulvivirga sediminis]
MKQNDQINQHLSRLAKALQFIDDHLSETLTLDEMAAQVCYSPFHFHRIFKALTQEPFLAYVKRRRMEKAAALLMRSHTSITGIAYEVGFADNAAFSKAFKKHYGVSPSQFREASPDRYAKMDHSKIGQEPLSFEAYLYRMEEQLKWFINAADIRLLDREKELLAYVSHIGDCNNIGDSFSKLLSWADKRNVLDFPSTKLMLIYHDSLKITPEENARFSAAITLNEEIEQEGEVLKMDFEGGKCVAAKVELVVDELEKVWTSMFMWLNANEYQVAERPCFEIYHSNWQEHPERKCLLELCVFVS